MNLYILILAISPITTTVLLAIIAFFFLISTIRYYRKALIYQLMSELLQLKTADDAKKSDNVFKRINHKTGAFIPWVLIGKENREKIYKIYTQSSIFCFVLYLKESKNFSEFIQRYEVMLAVFEFDDDIEVNPEYINIIKQDIHLQSMQYFWTLYHEVLTKGSYNEIQKIYIVLYSSNTVDLAYTGAKHFFKNELAFKNQPENFKEDLKFGIVAALTKIAEPSINELLKKNVENTDDERYLSTLMKNAEYFKFVDRKLLDLLLEEIQMRADKIFNEKKLTDMAKTLELSEYYGNFKQSNLFSEFFKTKKSEVASNN